MCLEVAFANQTGRIWRPSPGMGFTFPNKLRKRNSTFPSKKVSIKLFFYVGVGTTVRPSPYSYALLSVSYVNRVS